MTIHRWIAGLLIAALSPLVASCSTDCSSYDPAKDQSLFKASGGLASKCYQQNLADQRQRLDAERRAAADLSRQTAELEAQREAARTRNSALAQRTTEARDSVRALEGDVGALKNDVNPAARMAEIDKKMKAVEREIAELEKADTKSEVDKANFERQLKALREEYNHLLKVYQAFSK